jgi:uncharacterized membrane protein
MPYHWSESEDGTVRLRAWPYRSLPKTGFVAFIGTTAALLSLPLLAVLGSPVLWALLPFLMATVWAIWFALARSYRSGALIEELTLTPDLITLSHRAPGQPTRDWQANPYWVTPQLSAQPVPDYLTLTGGPRVVELGAFLTPAERRTLCADLNTRLRILRDAM